MTRTPTARPAPGRAPPDRLRLGRQLVRQLDGGLHAGPGGIGRPGVGEPCVGVPGRLDRRPVGVGRAVGVARGQRLAVRPGRCGDPDRPRRPDRARRVRCGA